VSEVFGFSRSFAGWMSVVAIDHCVNSATSIAIVMTSS
jgi:hypothetical protein